MRAAVTAGCALLLLVAGCVTPQAVHLPVAARAVDVSAFASCPVVRNQTWPCEGTTTNPRLVPVEPAVPSNWVCVSYWNQQTSRSMHVPDWYTFLGPAPPSDGPAIVGTEMGILYDTHSKNLVAGILQVRSESATQYYYWIGPGSGFIHAPVPLQNSHLIFGGILWPATPSSDSLTHDSRFSEDPHVSRPGFHLNVTGLEVDHASIYLSLEAPDSPNSWWWDPTLTVRTNESAVVHAAFDAPWVQSASGSSDNWGVWLPQERKVTASGPGWNLTAAIQPWMIFHGEFYDYPQSMVNNKACACASANPLTADGIRCILPQTA